MTTTNGTPTPDLRESLKAIQEATGQTPAQLKQTLFMLADTFKYMAEAVLDDQAYSEYLQQVCKDVDAALAAHRQAEHTPPA